MSIKVGSGWLSFFSYPGAIVTLGFRCSQSLFTSLKEKRFPFKNTFIQMAEIGYYSLPIISAASLFTGMVMVVQVGSQFEKFGARNLIGGIIALTLAREVAPAMTAIILAGRMGSAYAAEIGSMVVTEQVDALKTMATDPIEFLVLPRMLASTTMILSLTLFFNFLGLMGGYLVGQGLINISYDTYFDSIIRNLGLFDLIGGLLKSFAFATFLTLISCQEGFSTKGGAIGVGEATTRAVVYSILTILFLNLLLSIGIVNFQKSPFFEHWSQFFSS